MCSVKAVVPTAPTHQVRKPCMISSPYPIAPATPITAPTIESTRASPPNSFSIDRSPNPSARNNPTSVNRCSTPSLKNRAASSSAETTRKKLK
jgi:hypothetical protein